ncbi:MAG: EF-hand domain-containing protein [Pseudomonadota bacterium]
MIRIVLLTTAIAIGFTATQSSAERGPRGEPVSFSEIDTDGNGQLTQDEIAAFRERAASRRFSGMDADGDSALSPEEARSVGGARLAERLMERFDADGDGALTEAELRSGFESRGADRRNARFARADADGNGTISAEEFADAQNALRQAFRDRRAGQGSGRAPLD